MQTRKLYYEDSFQKGFASTVVSCEESKGGYAVVLEETAFYPEGGGQPCDVGTLGSANVLDVREKDGVIVHLCDRPLTAGASVSGKLDWARRFDHMQQHSGEHICSGLICARFHCDNVGFHMGADTVTIDFNADISWEALLEIEQTANLYIYEDHPIDIQFHRGAELDKIDYRSKKPLEGDVRIVSFPGADCCACCGTHVAATGEIGLIKLLSAVSFRGGTRIEMACGSQALALLNAAFDQNRQVSQAFSAKITETGEAARRMNELLSAQKYRMAGLEKRVFAGIAESYGNRRKVLNFEEGLIAEGDTKLEDAISDKCGGTAAVFSGSDGGYAYCLIARQGDLRQLGRDMTAALHGRGGGKPLCQQGRVQAAKGEIEAFFADRQ